MAAKKQAVSKMEAVRQAMQKLGFAASRSEIQAFVKETFGMEMNADVISTYKADIARKAKKAGTAAAPAVKPAAHTTAPKRRRRRRRTKSVAAQASTTTSATKAAAIGLHDIGMVSGLVRRLGAAELKSLVDILA